MIKNFFEESAAGFSFFAVVADITDEYVCFQVSENEDELVDFSCEPEEWALTKEKTSHLGNIKIDDLYRVTKNTQALDEPDFLFEFLRNVDGETRARFEKALGYTLDTIDIDEFFNDPRFS